MTIQRFALACALAVSALPAAAQVSVTVGQPGFYGRLDLGGLPQPEVVYAQPVIVQRARGTPPPPVYLRVPPAYQKNWRRHCAEYGACGQPVYFVREDWYQRVYEPRRRDDRDRGRRGDRDDRGPRGDDRRDDRRGDGRDRGH